MNRRRFCELMVSIGGTGVLAPWLQACRRAPSGRVHAPTAAPHPTLISTPAAATASPSPTATTAPQGARVALVSTTERADGVRRAIELLGVQPALGRHVLLKPNFNSADPAPGSTHADTLRTMLAALTDMGAIGLTVADRSGGGDTASVMRDLGVAELARSFGAETVALDEVPDADWEKIEHDGCHWPRGFYVPKLLLDAECVVQTCNLKTHRHGGHFTLSLKNSIGLVAKHHGGHNYMNDLHTEPDQRRMIAEANVAYTTALIVVDGVQAFIKGGPDTGTLADTGVILAGTDRVAVDAVGVAILRLFGTTAEVARGTVFEQEQIARAVELGLGVDDGARIEVVTADAESNAYAERVRAILAG